MNISIIGASAGIGLLTVKQALEKGHKVTALARNTASIPDYPLLTKLTGDATSASDLKKAVRGADAILITVGTKKKNTTPLFADTATTLLQVAADVSITAPVIVITGFGAGESSRYLNLFMRLVIRLLLKKEYADKTNLETIIAQSSLKWEIVRPGILTKGPRTNTYKVITELNKGIKIGKIARADVADFLLREAENPTMLYQYPALSS